MTHRRTIRSRTSPTRAAFTLVEMLVATGLVILIMLLFAQIYGSAIGSITEQRGLANNDQKARQFDVTIRQDLQSMTYRQPTYPYADVRGIVPLAPGDELIIDPFSQRGFFYYSENDPIDQTDDVLHFTIMQRTGQRGEPLAKTQQRKFVGKAESLNGLGVGMASEPEFDDGIVGNAQSHSRAAEVVYFLRNGNLYRRQLLIRDPLQTQNYTGNQPTLQSPVPFPLTPQSGVQRFRFIPDTSVYQQYAGDFWNDFDSSATRIYQLPLGGRSYPWFHSIDSLDNHLRDSNNPLALPWNRFGFLNEPEDLANLGNPNPHHGNPREFADDNPANPTGPQYGLEFIGRMTHEETSHPDFNWPEIGTGASLLRHSRAANGTLTNGAVTGLDFGPRIGEDIILANVESFDVQLFDHLYLPGPRYVNLGEPDGLDNGNFPDTEMFSDGDRLQVVYGPRMPSASATPTLSFFGQNRVFDTWHPDARVLNPNNVVPPAERFSRLPPYRPLTTNGTNTAIVPANNKVQELGFFWQPNTLVPPNQVYFPLAGEDQRFQLLDNLATNNTFNPIPPGPASPGDRNANGTIDYPGLLPSPSLVARIIGFVDPTIAQPRRTGLKFPEWPLVPGSIVEDGNIIWQIQDNRVGVRGMRIIVRYRDQRSNIPRQLTIVHSFVE